MKLPYRIQQVMYYRSAGEKNPPTLPRDARERLTDHMAAQFSLLSLGDQHHLLRVYDVLKATGAEDDTLTAGLIHDVGKACRKCTITILDRSLHVLCNRLLFRSYTRFASLDQPPERLLGLHCLANHAERGASAAAQAGYNDRICWLIRHHEKRQHPSGTDPELLLLREADDFAGRTHVNAVSSAIPEDSKAQPVRATL